MRRLATVALVVLLGALAFQPPAKATCLGVNGPLQGFASETLSVGAAAQSFTVSKWAPAGQLSARRAYFSVETQAVRWWTDGTVPTASVGQPTAAGGNAEICGFSDLTNFKIIAQSSTATVTVSYER